MWENAFSQAAVTEEPSQQALRYHHRNSHMETRTLGPRLFFAAGLWFIIVKIWEKRNVYCEEN